MIVVSNISKTISRNQGPSFRLFEDFSWQIPTGGIHAVLGESGSGKSTMLRMLIGEQRVDSGEIRLHGLAPDIFCRNGRLGYAEQEPTLLPWRTLRQNVMLPGQLKKRQVQPSFLEELIEYLGLDQQEDHAAVGLSGGQRKRLAFARAFADQSDTILLDEPFSGVDLARRLRMYRWLYNYSHSRPDTTIVLVTHNIEEAALLSTTATVVTSQPRCTVFHQVPFKEAPLPVEAMNPNSLQYDSFINNYRTLHALCLEAWGNMEKVHSRPPCPPKTS